MYGHRAESRAAVDARKDLPQLAARVAVSRVTEAAGTRVSAPSSAASVTVGLRWSRSRQSDRDYTDVSSSAEVLTRHPVSTCDPLNSVIGVHWRPAASRPGLSLVK